MRISIDTELDGLGQAVAELLPAGIVPTSVRLTATQLRIDGKVRVAVITKTIALTARVERSRGMLRLHEFDLEGAMGLGSKVLSQLRRSIATVEERWGPFRVKGEGDGSALVVTWT